MLTFAQWQDTRRVDHVNIPIVNFHPRFRVRDPNLQPDLKIFDPLVQGYATAKLELDQVIILGDILDLTAAFLANYKSGADRYQKAVETLQKAAESDLRQRLTTRSADIQKDIVAAANGQMLAPKTININVYYLGAVGPPKADLVAIDAIINRQIVDANSSAAFQMAQLQIFRKNANATFISETPDHQSILLTDPPAKNMAGKLQDSSTGGQALISALNAKGGEGVDVVFLQEYDQNDIQGRTFRAGQKYPGGLSPNRPIVTARTTPAAGGGPTHSTTLLHEICHAISGNPDHIQDPDNLMASGSVRTGRNLLSSGQIGWYRNNAWVA